MRKTNRCKKTNNYLFFIHFSTSTSLQPTLRLLSGILAGKSPFLSILQSVLRDKSTIWVTSSSLSILSLFWLIELWGMFEGSFIWLKKEAYNASIFASGLKFGNEMADLQKPVVKASFYRFVYTKILKWS